MSDQELNQILDKIRKNDNKNFPKSKVGFQKWTKKMSKNENPKILSLKNFKIITTREGTFFNVKIRIYLQFCSKRET